jgi:hypothetical protein
LTLACWQPTLGAIAKPVYDRRGRRRGAVVLLEDVTQTRRDEARLREQARSGSRCADPDLA